jgi:hypothetical protein
MSRECSATSLRMPGMSKGLHAKMSALALLTVDFGTPSYKFTVNICTYVMF